MKKWIFIIVLATALGLNGCADTADAESSTLTTASEESNNDSTTTSSSETIWVAIVMTWNPVVRTIDKEFSTEVRAGTTTKVVQERVNLVHNI